MNYGLVNELWTCLVPFPRYAAVGRKRKFLLGPYLTPLLRVLPFELCNEIMPQQMMRKLRL